MTILDVTDRCNLKCTYCCRGTQKGKITELNNQDILTVAQQIIQMRGTFFVLQGGEPSLKKHIILLLQDLAKLKPVRPGYFLSLTRQLIEKHQSGQSLKISYMKTLIEQGLPLYCMTTNGMFYTKALEKALYDAGFYLEVSIDAPTEAINQQTRIGMSYNKVISNIRKFVQRLPVEISCTIAEHNVKELSEMIPFAIDQGCVCLKLSPVIMIGDRDKPDSLWAEQYIDAVNFAIEKYEYALKNILLKVKIYPEYLNIPKGQQLHDKLLRCTNVLLEVHECTACRQVKNIYIDPDMNVYPCASMKNERDLILGNLREMTLKEIWNSKHKRELENIVDTYNKIKSKHNFSCTAVAYSQLKHKPRRIHE